MSEQGLTVERLATGYGDIRVVTDVSLTVLPGKITALLGRNGAGKTTTLRAITGLNKASAGTVRLEGKDITSMPAHKRVGAGLAYVQEGKKVFREQTVDQNLVLGGFSRGLGRRKLANSLDDVYDMFPMLAERKNLLAGAMSGGQQQMLAIGQALMSQPKVLLLDEPSGGLAPVIVKDVLRQVEALKARGLAVLLVEQEVDTALSVADHVTVIDMGKVVMDKPVAAITNRDSLREAYLGRADMSSVT
ncbi:ABC transporter ATP-binding protein [Rhodococcus tukisamuensis]|uniref:Branched-chain amino acid transport system ATP-binding protein n=1 Tax=Rhodococcus tukisamuensis TaxID=168276 RepID=A0A1G6NT08_9NOCA|nr:ABC transporter ATP-binding protein [Rhodococcus tukisamuensis]SDC71073.1 branched-chain amino acid transport system ATP-binding protein [Rhodococcus tukisamuensis]